MTTVPKFIAYYRVSTKRQGKSGLGLSAQQEAVREYLNGGKWKLVEEVVEVESGKRKDRPDLLRALQLCKVHNATLLIAKLDRLARNVAFVSALMESGVEFIALDCPQANRFTVHILAAVAEHEANLISQRTKAALAAAKRRGVKLGWVNPNISKYASKGAKTANANRSVEAAERRERLLPIIADIKANGAVSLRDVAAELNKREIPAPRKGDWSATQVMRLQA
jgi:DNA invertase Pin-like site-specific DNA recombinase